MFFATAELLSSCEAGGMVFGAYCFVWCLAFLILKLIKVDAKLLCFHDV